MLKKSNKIIVLISIFSFMSLIYLISAETLSPGESIQSAINSASPGGTILLNDGVYNVDGDYDINVTVNNLTIKAADGANPIINASGKNKRIFNISSDNVTLDGLTITGGTNDSIKGIGVYISGNNALINNCTITENNATDDNGAGIYITGTGNNINGCNISNNYARVGAGIYINNSGNNISYSTIANNKGTYGSGIYIVSSNNNVNYCNIIENNRTSTGPGGAGIGMNEMGSSNNINGCNINNNIGEGIYMNSNNNAVHGCNIKNNSDSGIFVNTHGFNNISYNRLCDNYFYSNIPSNLNKVSGGSAVYDYNWWGTNNINLAGITVGFANAPAPNNYFVIQLSVDDNYTRINTTMEEFGTVSLGYRMVLNGTTCNDNGNLPDFNTTIQLTNRSNVIINATEPWNTTLNNSGTYNFTAICDNEYLNIELDLKDHPRYDLSLRNEPQGQIMVGNWIKSVATAIDGTPLPTDHVRFKVTSLSDNNVQYDVNKSFGDSNSVFYDWQLTKKDTYKIEVWAYDKKGYNVKVPPLLGTRAMKLSVGYNPYYSVDYIDVR
jgi:frataxin-like iron-binding protein CyaY